MTNFDNILPYIGEFGRYQKIRFLILSSISGLYIGWAFGCMMFIIMPSDHWCKLPPRNSLPEILRNYSDARLQEFLIPKVEDSAGLEKWDKCQMRDPDKAVENFSSDESLIPCENGWEYDPNGKWMLMSEYDLVCDNAYLLSLMLSVRGIPGIVAMFVWIHLADIIGRKRVIFINWSMNLILGIVIVFSPNFTAYWAIGTFSSIFGEPLYLVPCILDLELVGPKYHALIVNFTGGLFAVGAATFAIVAYLVYSWKTLILIHQVTFIPVMIAYYFLIDESPRWLLSKGKNTRAIKIMEKISKINRTNLSGNEIQLLLSREEGPMEEKSKKVLGKEASQTLLPQEPALAPQTGTKGILTLFSTPNLALITSSLAFLWAVNMLVYAGMSYNIPNLGGNRYLVFAAMALIEIPASMLNMMVNKTGRIWPFGLSLFISGIALLAASLTSPKLVGVVIFFVVVAKLCITFSFNLVLQVGGELFPTVLRVTGCGFASTISRIIASLAPFVAFSAVVFHALPTLIMSVIAVAGGFVVFFLPETKDHVLPETVEDSKNGLQFGIKSFLRNVTCRCLKENDKDKGVEL